MVNKAVKNMSLVGVKEFSSTTNAAYKKPAK